MLGIAMLAAIHGAVGFLFTRAIVLIIFPVLTGAMGYGLLQKRRFAVFLLCIMTVAAGIFALESLLGGSSARLRVVEPLAPAWWTALTIYWLPFSLYYARRWAEFR